MVPSSTPNPVSGTQSVSYCPLRTTSEMLVGTHSGSVPSQQPFASLVPSRSQLNSGNHMRLLGNIPNVSSFLNDTASPNLQHQSSIGGAVDMVGPGELDPLSFISPSVPSQGQHLQNMSANQLAFDNSQPEQLDGMQNFQRQLSMAQNQQQIQLRGGLGNVGSVVPGKVEPQLGSSDQNGPPQHLHSLCSTGAVKLEPQQLHSMRGLDPFKLERQHSDAALFLQQQQLLQMPRPRSQAAAAQISLLQQQRILQQQQQQILKNLPQQRNQLQQQLQQNLLVRPQVKPTFYEPGMCARRLIHYMYHQRHRPDDNNIEFWRKFVAEYFAPNAKKRWCVSLYGSGRQTNGVFPQDAWYCEICNRKPGRGFETTFEVLPRLFQMKYASGTLEELLDVDMPQEYQNASGQIVLDYAKAIQESVFEQLRVVRQGQLRIVFSPDLKICSWEFCARRHEELIPRRLLMPQVSQLGTVFQKYQNAAQNSPSGLSAQDLQSTCNLFVATARQLAKTLEVPLVNDLGYTKRYVRCLQISEVVNSMKDLIDVSKETGSSPMDSLINFSKRTFASSGLHPQQVHQPVDQQMIVQSTSQNDQISAHASPVQLSSASNAVMGVANSLNDLPSTCATITNSGLRQSSMNARLDNHTASENGRHVGNTVQIPSTSSSSSLPSSHPNISSPFPSPMPSTSNNITPLPPHNTGHLNSAHSPVNMYTRKQLLTQSHEDDSTDTQSSVQQILQEMMMSSQLNGINSLGNELKGINGLTPALNVGSCRVGSAIMHNSSVSGMGLETMGGIGPLATAATSGTGVASNAMAMNGQVGINYMLHDPSSVSNHQQQYMGDRFLGGLGPVNNFNNLQFDWKSSP